jgi:serine/threonine protein kinase
MLGNILLTMDLRTREAVTAKIGDFGLSRSTADVSSMTAVVGTIQYMAPEMLAPPDDDVQFARYGPPVDIFSFGIILWQLLTAARPYEPRPGQPTNRWALLNQIAQEGLRPAVPAWASPPLRALIGECWAEAEHARPSAAELVQRLRERAEQETPAAAAQAATDPAADAPGDGRQRGAGAAASGNLEPVDAGGLRTPRSTEAASRGPRG